LLKTFVTFLTATPSLVCEFTAALDWITCGQPHLPQILEHDKIFSKSERRKPTNDNSEGTQLGSESAEKADVPNYPISTLTQLLGHIVSLVNDEVLVEDLEDLASL
jgi:hypothetical protein